MQLRVARHTERLDQVVPALGHEDDPKPVGVLERRSMLGCSVELVE